MNFSLLVTSGPDIGRSIILDQNRPLTFGRNQSNDHVLSGDDGISRQHFEISINDGRFFIRDLNSRNGTYLNRQSVITSELSSGDEIRAGSTTMIISIPDSGKANSLMRQAGVDSKSKVEFRFGDDEPTVADASIRFSKLRRQEFLGDEFTSACFDLPSCVMLLNVVGIRSEIDVDIDFETIGPQTILVFPRNCETMKALRDHYLGTDCMIVMNHNCRRSRLIAMINESLDKFASPIRLVEHLHDLPQEAAAGLLTGIDLAICETADQEYVDVIHTATHSSWLKRYCD